MSYLPYSGTNLLGNNSIETSLQNLVIRRFMQSKEGEKGLNNYKSQLDHELQGKQFSEINGRKFFALGTTVPVSLLDQEYLLFSITKTELKGAIPADNCNISNMWKALQLFWAEARIHSRGKDINIPLIGSGITGIDLPPAYILELNIIAVLDSLKEGGKITTGEIRVVLHPKYIEDIRLDILEQAWR